MNQVEGGARPAVASQPTLHARSRAAYTHVLATVGFFYPVSVCNTTAATRVVHACSQDAAAAELLF